MEALVEILVYILQVFKYFFVSYCIIGLKPSRKKTKYLVIPIVIAFGVVSYINASYTVLGDIILVCSIILLWFKEKKKLSVFSIAAEFISISFIDVLVWLMLVGLTPLGDDIADNETMIYLCSNTIGVLPLIGFALFIKYKKVSLRDNLKGIRLRNYLLIIIIMVAIMFTSGCLQGMFLGELVIGSQSLIVIVSAFFVVFVVVLCVLYIYVADSRNKLAEINNLDKVFLEYQKNYYAAVMKKDEELRAFKHDINKHMMALRVLYDEGKIEDMGAYLEKLTGKVESDYVYKTGNLIADYIVNGVIKEITQQTKLSVSIVGKFPQEMKLDDTEVSIVLANILTNAKEAILEYKGEKKLEIIIKNYKERLYLTVINSSNKRNTKTLKTTKKDRENHGYGILNVRRVVDKYEGSLEMNWSDGIYITEITL